MHLDKQCCRWLFTDDIFCRREARGCCEEGCRCCEEAPPPYRRQACRNSGLVQIRSEEIFFWGGGGVRVLTALPRAPS